MFLTPRQKAVPFVVDHAYQTTKRQEPLLNGSRPGWFLAVAEMRAKAGKAKDTTVTKFQDTKDRHSSVPLKNTNWDPYSKNPPPPPPPVRANQTRPTLKPVFPPPPSRAGSTAVPSASASRDSPPPIVRATRPSLTGSSSASPPPPLLPGRPAVPQRETRAQPEYTRPTPPPPTLRRGAPAELDWANLSEEDKQVLFAWLDEFFSRYLGKSIRAS